MVIKYSTSLTQMQSLDLPLFPTPAFMPLISTVATLNGFTTITARTVSASLAGQELIVWSFYKMPRIFFSFRPFPSVRAGHSVSSSFKPFCLQQPSPLHQLPSYLFLLHLQIFSLVSLFSSFPVTPFPSSFFLHNFGLS